jgi:uncharacterized protein
MTTSEKRYRYFLALMFAALLIAGMSETYGQAKSGEVFVANDYRTSENGSIVVKWLADKVYYPGGFNVYRKTNNEGDWVKINTAPVKLQAVAPQAVVDRDKEVKMFLDMVNKTPYPEFQKGVHKVFVAIKAVLSPDFAELLGIVYYDSNAQPGITYQYQVRGINGNAEEVINTTRSVTTGPFVRETPPKNIRIERKATGVEINWDPEELRYYGVYVERKSTAADSTWKKLNKLPRSVYKSKDQKGVDSYPPIFYHDTKVQKDQAYEYRLAVADYFGQVSDYSEVKGVPVMDFDPPLAPLDLKVVDMKVMDLTLSWTIQSSPDLAGFKIYRSPHPDSVMRAIHPGLLPKDQVLYSDRVLKTGGYYYSVAAVDVNANESPSQKIFNEVRDVTPPAPPQNVFVSTDTGRVVLRWSSNTEADLRGYYVYRSLPDGNHADNEFIVVNKNPITENTYTEVLPKNTRSQFVYAVVAEDQSLNRSKRSAISVVRLPDAAPPSRPVIKDVVVEQNTLVVEWLPNRDRDLAGYNIFRSRDSTSFSKMNVNPYPARTYRFTDREVEPGIRYYYYIQALDSAGNSSVASNVFTGINNNFAEENISPANARVEYVKARKEVRVSWSLPAERGLLGAVIFKSKDKTNFRPLTGLMKETTYNDKEVQTGTTYYYQVRSYSSTGTVATSPTLETIVKE